MSTGETPQPAGDAGRWAPFPVQDWASMPPAPAPAYGWVDPTWGPPTPGGAPPADRRPRWLPLLVVVLVTVLVGAGLYAGERIGGAAARSAASAYLPDDGAVAFQRRETLLGSQSTASSYVQESAAQAGAGVLGGVDWNLGVKIIGALGGVDDLDRKRFWRTTATQLANLGSSQQHVTVRRVDGPVVLLAESDRSRAEVYTPGLVELPADVAPGARWSSEGTIGTRRYRSDLTAAAGAPGCLEVTGTVVESTASGQPGTTRQLRRTWCQGRGLVAEEVVRGDVRTRTTEMPRPDPDPGLQTSAAAWSWTDPAGWRQRDFGLMSTDASLGSGAMAGTPSEIAPVITASGLVFRPTTGDDLVATTPKSVDQWTSLWRMHPGGTLVTAAAFGNVVVTSTSRRELVGYADAGIRLWTVALDDVAFQQPVRVDDRRIAVADASGAVRVVDLLTGEQAWRRSVGHQVSAPLVADAGTVVVLDAGGSTTAFDAGSGEQRWREDISGPSSALFGDVVVVRNDATLEGLDLRTGRHRWLLPLTGTLDALQPFGDDLVVATQLGTVVIDRQATIRHRLPSYEWVTVEGEVLVGWGRTETQFLGPDYTVRHTIDTPDLSLTSALTRPLAYRQGVMLFGTGWTFTTWSDEP